MRRGKEPEPPGEPPWPPHPSFLPSQLGASPHPVPTLRVGLSSPNAERSTTFGLRLGPPQTHLCPHDWEATSPAHAPSPCTVACPGHSVSRPAPGSCQRGRASGKSQTPLRKKPLTRGPPSLSRRSSFWLTVSQPSSGDCPHPEPLPPIFPAHSVCCGSTHSP